MFAPPARRCVARVSRWAGSGESRVLLKATMSAHRGLVPGVLEIEVGDQTAAPGAAGLGAGRGTDRAGVARLGRRAEEADEGRRALPAKVNLHLEVLGKRSDGYHELRTLFASVGVRDTLELQPAPGACWS